MKRKTFVLFTILIVLLTTVIVYSADAAGIPKKAISTVATFLKTDLPTTTVFTDQSNTFGAFTQIFQGTVDHQQGTNNFGASKIVIRNPASTFATTLTNPAVAANRTLNLPLITGTDTLGALNVASKWTANQTLQTPQINGLDINYTTYAADHTAVNTEDVILMDASAASRALTLPTAVGNTGKEFTIVNGAPSAGNMVRILTTSSQTIDGYFSATGSLNLTNADTKITVQSDGSNWNSINSEQASVFDYYLRGSTTRWYGSATDPTASGTILSVVSTLRATPWIVSHPITIDKIQTEISTAANPTSTTCNIGIYRDNGNIYPQALVSGSDVGTFTTTAAVKTLTFGSPITLTKGLYWLAWTCGTAATTQPTFRATPVGAVPPVLGYVSTMGANGAGTAYTVAFVYGALPAQYPAGATILANSNTPMILVEITKG